ncbi:putative aBC transporter, partial [Chlamydia psittaci 08DC60]
TKRLPELSHRYYRQQRCWIIISFLNRYC